MVSHLGLNEVGNIL